ncbi:acetyltransferase [Streptomyces longisporoflavus]|uniref:GNAT family N-acetyltransferase n=1 Tax=Streptomyces longisporoflavus TaxID=28044 RepID=UPI00167D764F|nr:GNAT family N-acetyltransferase [Streptomyces longisporoflavus]GGV22466.1 acetyltransferase [Streptomyces longisporoflavus]
MPKAHAREISTARLDLVPLQVEHADEMADVLSDPALHAFIGGSPDDPQALRARYRRMTAGAPDPAVSWCNWVLRLRDEGCLAGTVQATVGPGRDGALVAEIAWVVGTPWQGRGIAVEAARGLVEWLARQPDVRGVIAHVHPDHRASAAVAAAAGLAPTDEWQDGEVKWQRNFAS